MYKRDNNSFSWLSERRVGPFPRKLAQKQGLKPCCSNSLENDAVPTRDCVVGEKICFGKVKRYEMSSEISFSDLSREGRHPLLRNRPGSGVNKPPLQHPVTQQYSATEITLRLKNGAWPQAWMWRNTRQALPRGLSREEVGFPLENTLC